MGACGVAQPLEQLEEPEAREEAGEKGHLSRRERKPRVLVGEPDGQQAADGLGLERALRPPRRECVHLGSQG